MWYSQSVGQEGRKERAKGDLEENSVTFHQISRPHCELSALWEGKHNERRQLISITVRLRTRQGKKKRGLPIMSYFCSVSVNKWTSTHLYSPLLIGCSTCPTKNMSIQIFSAEKKIVTHAASSVPTSFNLNVSNNVDGCESLSPFATNFAYLHYCQTFYITNNTEMNFELVDIHTWWGPEVCWEVQSLFL